MRVLLLTHRLPYAPNRGDRIRSHHLVRALAPRVELHLCSLVHDRQEEEHADLLRRLGVRVTTFRVPRVRNLVNGAFGLAGGRPLTHALLDAPGVTAALGELVDRTPPDAVLAYCSGMARFALQRPLAGRPLVIDMVDVDSRKWQALSRSAWPPSRWVYGREAKYLSRFEQRAAQAAATTLVVNERERSALAAVAPGATIEVVPNGIDLAAFRAPFPPAESSTVVFCGVMNYQPNVEAMSWFAKHVWPRIIARRPDARLAIVGSAPVARICRLAVRDRSIHVTGTVADVRSFLWEGAVSVAPLFMARGIQNKVLEAVAAGLPAVVTPQVMEGLPSEVRLACSLAAEPETFADAVVGLLATSAAERRRIAGAANLEALAWDRQLAPVIEILADAAARTTSNPHPVRAPSLAGAVERR